MQPNIHYRTHERPLLNNFLKQFNLVSSLNYKIKLNRLILNSSVHLRVIYKLHTILAEYIEITEAS
jgi:hypothetical protein